AHGDTTATADAVSAGSLQSAMLETATDVDVFSFTATANHTYRFQATPQGTTSTNLIALAILSSGGATVASSTINYSNSTAWVAYVAPTAGTYYAQVKANNWSGSYTYKLEDVVDDYGNTPATATAITPSATVNSGVLEVPTD